MVDALRKRPEAWVDFMMRFELGLEKPEPRRALGSAVTIAAAYVTGGFIPLGPYMAMKATMALPASVGILDRPSDRVMRVRRTTRRGTDCSAHSREHASRTRRGTMYE